MKLYKVIIALISLLVLSEVALAGSKKPTDTNGIIGSMPMPKLLGNDLKYSMHTEWQDSQLVQQGASGRGQGQGHTLISNKWGLLPYVPSIHQSKWQGTTYNQQCLQIHRISQLVILQLISRYRHK